MKVKNKTNFAVSVLSIILFVFSLKRFIQHGDALAPNTWGEARGWVGYLYLSFLLFTIVVLMISAFRDKSK